VYFAGDRLTYATDDVDIAIGDRDRCVSLIDGDQIDIPPAGLARREHRRLIELDGLVQQQIRALAPRHVRSSAHAVIAVIIGHVGPSQPSSRSASQADVLTPLNRVL
jgi:hypothetical protein